MRKGKGRLATVDAAGGRVVKREEKHLAVIIVRLFMDVRSRGPIHCRIAGSAYPAEARPS